MGDCTTSLYRNPEQLIAVLRAVDRPHEKSLVPDGGMWTALLMREMRAAAELWRNTNHLYRIDEIDRQFALCRVAAGINWANKPLSPKRRRAALSYAGWAAREYILVHQPAAGPEVWQNQKTSQTSDGDSELWQQLWTAAGAFSGRSGRYILVATPRSSFGKAKKDFYAEKLIGRRRLEKRGVIQFR